MKTIVPPIKSQGIKTKLVPWIVGFIPDDFTGRWIEPFMGTGVVGFNAAPRNALMCDTNPHLIDFYNSVKSGETNAQTVRQFLEAEGAKLLKKEDSHYYEIRERFNETHQPLDFLFLSRAGFNGMMRFNRKGGFNIPFCKKPNRFAKAYVTKIVNQVDQMTKLFAAKDFEFRCQSYATTIAKAGPDDLIYCDPPYVDRHVDYYNGWSGEDEQALFESLSGSDARFLLSTWHHNQYRANDYIDQLWTKFSVVTREHFYHVGGKEKNRNPMIEALIGNWELVCAGSVEALKSL